QTQPRSRTPSAIVSCSPPSVHDATGPRLDELEPDELSHALKVALIVRQRVSYTRISAFWLPRCGTARYRRFRSGAKSDVRAPGAVATCARRVNLLPSSCCKTSMNPSPPLTYSRFRTAS